jgi:hypothetical protein
LTLACTGTAVPACALAPDIADRVTPRVALKAEPFSLEDVRLLDGPFRHAMELDRRYLLSLDPDRLLHVFRLAAGIRSTARPYGGWMAPDHLSRGEFAGHYMTACALMVASTGDERLKDKAARVVAGLAECQEKLGTGFVHAHPDTFTSRREAPLPFWYQIHKVMAGLLDVHRYCGNQQALDVARRLGDWACAAAEEFTEAQFQAMLTVEHGGINEALANLYARTGDPKYLRLSLRFNHAAVLGPAMKQMDALDGLHANTQFPKFIGAGRQYEFTGDESLRTAPLFFWQSVVHERSYCIGGNSDAEIFTPKKALSQALGPATCETCNTYNMLRLTRRLFAWEPRAEYADFYERALWNHILASQNPETGMMCYYVPLKTGCAKGRLNPTGFSTPEDSFWCCVGTGIESHAKHGDSIYFHDGGKSLYVNLFIASELTWGELGLKLRQETRFPETDASRLVFTCQKPLELTLNLRHPYWATAGIDIAVNGRKQPIRSRPSSFVALTRRWQSGDTVDIRMPMGLRTEGFRDNPSRLAVLYGPLVLCSTVDPQELRPAIVSEIQRIPSGIEPAGQPLCFKGSPAIFRGVEPGPGHPVTLVPFYRQYKEPYIVYWDVLSEAQWQKRQDDRRAETERQKAWAARTVDKVLIGDAQSEQAHGLKGEKSASGPSPNGLFRHAVDGGWFAYEMKPGGSQPLELLCTYWGGDSGNRRFDIIVDGAKLATQTLQDNHPGQLFTVSYVIPVERTRGKDRVTIRFQAHRGNFAGGVFGCRLVKKRT